MKTFDRTLLIARQLSAVRTERVTRLRQRIASGNYKVTSAAIAKSLLSKE